MAVAIEEDEWVDPETLLCQGMRAGERFQMLVLAKELPSQLQGAERQLYPSRGKNEDEEGSEAGDMEPEHALLECILTTRVSRGFEMRIDHYNHIQFFPPVTTGGSRGIVPGGSYPQQIPFSFALVRRRAKTAPKALFQGAKAPANSSTAPAKVEEKFVAARRGEEIDLAVLERKLQDDIRSDSGNERQKQLIGPHFVRVLSRYTLKMQLLGELHSEDSNADNRGFFSERDFAQKQLSSSQGEASPPASLSSILSPLQMAKGPVPFRDLHLRYEEILKVGEGSFGEVFVAKDTSNGGTVTMKRIRVLTHKENGLHVTTVKEIALMKSLEHPNVLPLLDVIILSDGKIVLVFPFLAYDLPGLMRYKMYLEEPPRKGARKLPFDEVKAKCIFGDVMEGLRYLHSQGVVHRDIKSSNVLIDSEGNAVLCDFGWARYYPCTPGARLTFPPATIIYRPPEVLAGYRQYGKEVDIWGAGCILYELLTGEYLVAAETEREAIDRMTSILGSPAAEQIPHVNYQDSFPLDRTVRRLHDMLRSKAGVSGELCNLLDGIFHYDPKKRLTAEAILQHPWFRTGGPVEKSCLGLPQHHTFSFLLKRKRSRKS